jgi:hypothetical protein
MIRMQRAMVTRVKPEPIILVEVAKSGATISPIVRGRIMEPQIATTKETQ